MSDAANSWFGSVENQPGAWNLEAGIGSFGRLWRAFMSARVTIAGVLVVLQAFIYALGTVDNGWSILICLAYFLATLAVRLWANPKPPRGTFDAQWVSTIGVDVVTFSALNYLQSSGINYTPLFALPVLLASILGPMLLALGTAASVTLFLLADAWWLSLQPTGEMTARFLQSALSGSGFFLVALLANQLALRLAREEQTAKSSRAVARMQTQVNELVIETLVDGILVIDANGIVRAANPAARRLLAAGDVIRMAPFVLSTETAWQPLVDTMRQTFLHGLPQQADVSLEYSSRVARRLHLRTRLAASYDSEEESLCVMFLEDLREMEARIRTEKLAAMGRMSAAVAHEIRNPLAAISQANALLEEDLKEPQHRQLTAMVSQNVQRLAKIVDEVLNISRVQVIGAESPLIALLLDNAVKRFSNDWAGQNSVSHRICIKLETGRTAVAFDPDHLRRLMINLLDNALRYASEKPDAIIVNTHLKSPGVAHLSVWSDGAPLEKSVQSHLFEPFFSSESRSSGLGLYICRELCERYGAVVAYKRSVRNAIEGNDFHVVFRSTAQAGDIRPSPFDLVQT